MVALHQEQYFPKAQNGNFIFGVFYFLINGKTGYVMLKIKGFSLVWVLMKWHAKSKFLHVTLNFELQ